jgi:hypothetical protein
MVRLRSKFGRYTVARKQLAPACTTLSPHRTRTTMHHFWSHIMWPIQNIHVYKHRVLAVNLAETAKSAKSVCIVCNKF